MNGISATAFEERLAALAAETGGTVSVREIGRIVASLLDSFEGSPLVGTGSAGPDADTTRELEGMLAYIHQTQTEIEALGPAELTTERIPHANDQLRSVVDATEAATGVFLDIAEELQALAETFGGAGAQEISDIVTRIYEASNFQDITGQRISKVTDTLRVIEQRLARLVSVGGRGAGQALRERATAPDRPPPEAPPAAGDSHLLNGPQLPDAAVTQDDIDRLFASL
ncbi:protein phosphatase CheZ [Zavarzinia compransoris]|uniref:protein phosphatase CheZ n=1 Tax=Zavarzinia marina TaxID=2911065 RepID=UPI001F21DEAF|nr:protein phosphatase CheZ [Zavarzinia marina]MCF4166572.1 protein phosphatase CheZ [Zavarzinia marina]